MCHHFNGSCQNVRAMYDEQTGLGQEEKISRNHVSLPRPTPKQKHTHTHCRALQRNTNK